jgi:hypothetical protein
MKIDKQQSRQRWAELTSLFNEWDVLGVMGSPDSPHDEYDDLVGMVMRLLEQDADEKRIAQHLHQMLKHHYGLSLVPNTNNIAAKAKAWFMSKWNGSTV